MTMDMSNVLKAKLVMYLKDSLLGRLSDVFW